MQDWEEHFGVEDVLQRIINWLREHGKNLDDPREKRSHLNKPLVQHVEECWKLSDKILRKLGLDDELRRFCFSLCVVHDLGKLDPRWQIGSKERPNHADVGKKLLDFICKERELTRLLPLPNEFETILVFATSRHHSSLHLGLETTMSFQRQLRRVLSRGISLSVGIADAIGVFKLADIVSASGLFSPSFCKLLLSQYEWSECLGAKIEGGVKRKAEEKSGFDPEKYKLQSGIASSQHKHLIVAAPTGWGKTALSLLRAKEVKPCKIFYVLPTITAIREFEQTLEEIFGPEYVGEYFYFADAEYLLAKENLEESVYPIDFYRYFIPKVIVTTIDQILLAALQFGRYHARRYNLRRSLLIFDEFHLFTPQMIGALKAIFEELASIYDFSVLLMSATPSTLYANTLREALTKSGSVEVKVLKDEYKRLRRHFMKLEDLSLVEFLQKKRSEFEKERVLIIANRVDEAVQIYNFLKNEEKRKVSLIHGRFAYIDRIKKEAEAKNAEVLVSTQVAEVSLDISYDVLITELAPIPSLIQRFGRVNRYGKLARKTNVYVCKPEKTEPYLNIELVATREILGNLINGLHREGESIYLSVLNEYYEKLTKDPSLKIEKMYEIVKNELDKFEHFYNATGVSNLSEMLGREPSCLAVPRNYLCEVKRLYESMEKEKAYEERRELLAKLKGYLISAPLHIMEEDGMWDDNLHLYIVGNEKYVYDPEIGLIKRKLTS